jgi:Flp pilus assembly pilin Flp
LRYTSIYATDDDRPDPKRQKGLGAAGRHCDALGMTMLDRLRTALTALRTEYSGATSIEYALIAVFISILVVGWATFVGTSVSNFFMAVGNGF